MMLGGLRLELIKDDLMMVLHSRTDLGCCSRHADRLARTGLGGASTPVGHSSQAIRSRPESGMRQSKMPIFLRDACLTVPPRVNIHLTCSVWQGR